MYGVWWLLKVESNDFRHFGKFREKLLYTRRHFVFSYILPCRQKEDEIQTEKNYIVRSILWQI